MSVNYQLKCIYLNLTKDIYDENVTVEWHMRIRAEKKFNGIDELVEQIAKR